MEFLSYTPAFWKKHDKSFIKFSYKPFIFLGIIGQARFMEGTF